MSFLSHKDVYLFILNYVDDGIRLLSRQFVFLIINSIFEETKTISVAPVESNSLHENPFLISWEEVINRLITNKL